MLSHSVDLLNCSRMADITISTVGVEKLLKGLNRNKAVGPDNVHPWVLSEVASDLAPMLSHLYQQSLSYGRIPADWKRANVCPIYKKNDSSVPSNYRPVSLTCICCKLLEHIISSNLMDFFESNNTLSNISNMPLESRIVVILSWCQLLKTGLHPWT